MSETGDFDRYFICYGWRNVIARTSGYLNIGYRMHIGTLMEFVKDYYEKHPGQECFIFHAEKISKLEYEQYKNRF